MHPALCIDEIIQLVFDLCGTLPDTRPRWTYSQLARCCKTWTDPALDRLWRTMNGLEPLLTLLPKTEHEYVSPSFEAAAKRVRQVLYTKNIYTIPSFRLSDVHGIHALPHLEVVTLSHSGCLVPHIWLVSKRIQRVILNLMCFRKETNAHVVLWSDAMARYLQQLLLCAPQFHSLQIRGSMSDALNANVASLRQLRNLSIWSGRSIQCGTLASIMAFPFLRTLDVHADYIHAERLEEALDSPDSTGVMCFPALEELKVRSASPVIMTILARLPTGVLKTLHLDVMMDAHPHDPNGHMKSILELVAQKGSDSLRDLFISARSSCRYGLDALLPLARTDHLQSCVLEDADLIDADLEALARWWPELERLDLSKSDWIDEDEDHGDEDAQDGAQRGCKQELSPTVYALTARSFRLLRNLSLSAPPPREVAGGGFVAAVTTLVVGSAQAMPGYTVDAAPAIVDTLLAIFPALQKLESPDAEIQDRFRSIIAERIDNVSQSRP